MKSAIRGIFGLLSGMALAMSSADAAEMVGYRLVSMVGCHHTNGTCYAQLDGAAFGTTTGCTISSTNEFRFDDGDTAIGRRSYASLLTAYLTKKHVSVNLNGCTGQGYPKLDYFQVMD